MDILINNKPKASIAPSRYSLPETVSPLAIFIFSVLSTSCLLLDLEERIHVYCRNNSIRKLVQIPNSSQIVLNDHPYAYMQNQLDEEIKYNSINLFNFFIEIPKIVFSKTLDKSQWINTEIAKGDFQTEITRIKNQQGMDIIVYGGASFDSSLIKEMLIDEFLLFINPVAIGNGMRIYSKT